MAWIAAPSLTLRRKICGEETALKPRLVLAGFPEECRLVFTKVLSVEYSSDVVFALGQPWTKESWPILK
jgi:hypothetical protein